MEKLEISVPSVIPKAFMAVTDLLERDNGQFDHLENPKELGKCVPYGNFSSHQKCGSAIPAS